ncbi:hypothetical protein Micbo1qcDRAFT_220506 [Microdochium bolleyi]|uniref:Uncharacterized protein n=1 Tax=Microdochium bolleyi TaxID=196109 RepID=A0A136J9P5_9PEZI|nr:hypothetical protein Micbo1qcDRAFT_220506 [Microdochium bolleyi]
MLATYAVQTLSLLSALVMAAPAPAPAAGPTISTRATSDFGGLAPRDAENADVSIAADTVKIQYYKDWACRDYNVDFTISLGTCYNYGFTGTHSANSVSWPGGAGASVACFYYSDKDCQGASHGVWRDGCVSDLTRYESVRCRYL